MRLIYMRLRAWWLAARAAHAGDIMAYREADYREAEAVYLARLAELRKARIAVAMHDKAPVLIDEIVSR